ncbi:MAG: glycosyltransferase family 39 protein [Candidatus Levybacteria bacterium]|nr:glycosyltransferase family 39 protein [Candidatus Levybacteria bacterium]
MKTLGKLEKSKEVWFIIFTSFLFFILRFPSLFEPLWYGDEGIYQVVGTSLNNGKLLYKEIFDNKPPLLYWTYAILQSDQFLTRLASLIVGVLTVALFFFLSKKLFKNKNNIHYISTFIFAVLFSTPILEGNIANAENFMLLPIVASSFFIVSQKKFFVAGLLLGIAFLFKIVAVFDLAAFFIFCLIINFNSIKKETKLSLILVGFLLPILTVILFFLSNGTLIDFLKATLISNVSYVSYGNKIGGFPLLLFLKLLLLGMFILYIFTKRKEINKTSLFVLIWFAFSLFNTFFSQRPYTHYVLVLIPSLSLMIGLMLFDKKYQKTIAIFIIISTIILIKSFGTPRFNKGVNYYQNFISYILGKKTTTSYQNFFDRNTPLDYEIARFIKPKINKNDTIFIWGNNAQLYELVGVIPPAKYIVTYHMTNYKDGIATTKIALDKTKPKFIVVMLNQKEIPFPLINYSKKINIGKAVIYERIF